MTGTERSRNKYRIPLILLVSLLFFESIIFAYLFVNNITAEVIWRSFIPTYFAGFVGLCITLWFSLEDKNQPSKFREQFKKKFVPSLAVGLTLSLFTLWFGLKEEIVEITFPAFLIWDAKAGEFLEKQDAKYEKYLGRKMILIRRYIKYTSSLNSNVFGHDFNYPPNVLFLEALTLLFSACQENEYSFGPSINPSYDASGIGGLYAIDPLTDSPFTKIPKNSLRIYKFPQSLKDQFSTEVQELYSQLEEKEIFDAFKLHIMYLPKDTIINIECNNIERNIYFKNEFCQVDVRIIWFGCARGIHEDWRWILDYNDDESKKYITEYMAIVFSAKFNKYRSGHPDMPKYKDWVNALTDRLRLYLDSEQQLKYAREKYLMYRNNREFCVEVPKSPVTKDNTIADPNS